MPDYREYLHLEWEKFVADPSRARASLEATAAMEIKRVLDVGCGAGQEMLPFITERGAMGVGIDIVPIAGDVGREKLAAQAPDGRVHFLRGSAEHLSFPDGVFDAVICRLALPYTDNSRALAEAARVLRPGGRYLLKIHGVRWYLALLKDALKSQNLMTVIYACRVLVAGSIYHLSRHQPRTHIPSAETFQSRWLLSHELKRHGLTIHSEAPDSNPLTPSFVIVKNS
ncbi:MAG TPA: class I SAM-dependent methyltransferase [Pyrinomonadaceae bacterium]|nr:class I SAM-dependent methyltransferase [Pyrinomonadaceae bacterium]